MGRPLRRLERTAPVESLEEGSLMACSSLSTLSSTVFFSGTDGFFAWAVSAGALDGSFRNRMRMTAYATPMRPNRANVMRHPVHEAMVAPKPATAMPT